MIWIYKVITSGSSGNATLISDGKTSLPLDAGLTIKEIQERTDFILPEYAPVMFLKSCVSLGGMPIEVITVLSVACNNFSYIINKIAPNDSTNAEIIYSHTPITGISLLVGAVPILFCGNTCLVY